MGRMSNDYGTHCMRDVEITKVQSTEVESTILM